ncbi:MAG: histidine triad nucleotide-binding protein [Desulfomonilaceae bacterium]
MADCIFCKIIEGKIPAKIVYQDELVVAFEDANPASPIHILIVPRKHIPTLNDVPENDPILSHIGTVARNIAADLGVAQTGYRFFINVNKGGGQVIFHLHAHLVSGKDMGTRFIKGAIVLAVGWRKLVAKLQSKS